VKNLKVVLSVMLSVLFLFGSIPSEYISAVAVKNTPTYLALGDSITTGYGLVNFSNNDTGNKTSPKNFVNKLGKRLGANITNMGVEGMDSAGLLSSITKPSTAEQKATTEKIKKADIISISIGGNNLLLPLITAINAKLGEGKTIYNAGEQDVSSAMLSMFFDTGAMSKLSSNLNMASASFNGDKKTGKTGDFAAIISAVKRLNPKAQIVVQTIYDPYKISFTNMFSDVIKSMNATIIKDSENGKNYKVADVYSAFSKAGQGLQLVNADSGKSFDPHPTAAGHEVIYTVMAAALQKNVLPYSVKTTVKKGRLTAVVDAGELKFTVIPDKGYKVPVNIALTVGKAKETVLELKNGKASVPVACINTAIAVTAVCRK
jgi:lysophospholipase L1-like esterase